MRHYFISAVFFASLVSGTAHAHIPVVGGRPDFATLDNHVAFITDLAEAIKQSKGCEYQGRLFPLGFKGNTESDLAGKVCTLEQDHEMRDGLRVPLSTYTAQWKNHSL